MTKAHPTTSAPDANPSPEARLKAYDDVAHRLFKVMTKKQRARAIRRLNRDAASLNRDAHDLCTDALGCCDLPDNVHPIRGDATTAKKRAARLRLFAAELDSRAEATRAIVLTLAGAFQ